MTAPYDAIVTGSGPNGLTAAAFLAKAGLRVLVIEAHSELGGGLRTAELTLPGFRHDVCSAVHTLGCLSPAFDELELERHGLTWIYPKPSFAHPLDDDDGVLVHPDLAATAAQLGVDGKRYERLVGPFVRAGQDLFADLLAPLRFPSHPFLMARMGMLGLWSATRLGSVIFREQRARALLAGCAAHAVLPLSAWLTGAVGLLFLTAAHIKPWPVARGGSAAIRDALVEVCAANGVEFRTQQHVRSLADLPQARCYLFDVVPSQLIEIASDSLPSGYLKRLSRFRMGPGVFKVDWALNGPIPWRNPAFADASTVHVGGTLEQIAASELDVARGRHPDSPFIIVAQQSHLDATRAPEGMHTGYAYCHVPAGSTLDMTGPIERQLERFAPGFRDRIVARHTTHCAALEAYNPSYVGGAIGGGTQDIAQMFTRPVARLNPYTTPNPKLFLCSQSTPPGGGVHGMPGYHAAKAVLARWKRLAS